MHYFQYKNREMCCEDIPISNIAEAVGTPFYLYSHATIVRHYKAFNDAFQNINRMVCYSAKANTSLAVLKTLANQGAGLDIVSGGELFRGIQAGFKPEMIVYSGVGKRIDEIDYALNTGILMFNIESREELEIIHARAQALDKPATISIRVNPDVDPKTHPHISTGLKKNKFGIDTQSSLEAYVAASRMSHIRVAGIDCHIGSQITHIRPFEDALKSLLGLIDRLHEMGMDIRYLDMGGGLGITYGTETPPNPTEYAGAIARVLGDRKIRLIFEPGRVIMGNAGILVTRVLYRKSGSVKEFVITDAAMNDLIRPILYDAWHDIKPVIQSDDLPGIVADVVGPICESGDFLAQGRQMPDVKRGDLLAVMSAGAYGFAMSSNYCSRLRVAEVMVSGKEYAVIRERENLSDLIRGESVPSFL
ncbi:MAG: diaminopimelate decarboxylase [Desulfatirhabdiaceae bacterium]